MTLSMWHKVSCTWGREWHHDSFCVLCGMDGWPLWPSHTPRLGLLPRKEGMAKEEFARSFTQVHLFVSVPSTLSMLNRHSVIKIPIKITNPPWVFIVLIKLSTAPRSTFVLCSHGVVAWLFRYKLVLDIYTRYVHAGLSGHSSASHAPAMPKYLRPTRETSFFTREWVKSQSHQIRQTKCDWHATSTQEVVASKITSPVLLESGFYFGVQCRGTKSNMVRRAFVSTIV